MTVCQQASQLQNAAHTKPNNCTLRGNARAEGGTRNTNDFGEIRSGLGAPSRWQTYTHERTSSVPLAASKQEVNCNAR